MPVLAFTAPKTLMRIPTRADATERHSRHVGAPDNPPRPTPQGPK
jgi:hypothetical protein